MDLTIPKLWTLGENIKSILENMPDEYGSEERMFNNITHGFTTPDENAADKLPLACVLPPENGTFKSENGLSVDNVKLSLPVYAYFHIPDPADAILTMYRFLQLLAMAIQDMNFSWFDRTINVIPGEFAIGDVLKYSAGKEMTLKPPFYGVYVMLDVRIDDSAL
ncbi:MAG: hypothetical protein ACLFSQ_11090 [Candidatus Zixiibacteriota bacterium]